MKKGVKTILLCIGGLAVIGAITMAVLALTGQFRATFRKVTDSELFAAVPLMEGENATYSEAEDVGAGNDLIWLHNTTLEEYRAYLALLEKNHFTKYTDNGENGLEGYVYTAHYQKGDLLVVVTYYTRLQDTMITVCKGDHLSDHLIYRDEYVQGNLPDAKTTLAELEMYKAGNSFVFQLKNGHYIINDGGMPDEVFYLLDFLEENAPNGEKPVVEAWVISHAHEDHMGVLRALMRRPELAERIRVEGLYFTQASDAANEERRGSIMMTALTTLTVNSAAVLRTCEGEITPLYRMREGERYYFSDITMDVVFAQDVLNYRAWHTSNAQSTTLMYTVEGQKVYIPADSDYECQLKTLEIFDDSYFDLAIYVTPHHGGNVYDRITSHLQYKTVVNSSSYFSEAANGLLSRLEQQEYLISRSEEHLAWGDGGLVFSFPYSVGEYERLPKVDWAAYKVDMETLKN